MPLTAPRTAHLAFLAYLLFTRMIHLAYNLFVFHAMSRSLGPHALGVCSHTSKSKCVGENTAVVVVGTTSCTRGIPGSHFSSKQQINTASTRSITVCVVFRGPVLLLTEDTTLRIRARTNS